MIYTHGGTPEKNTKRVNPYGVRVEGKAYPTGETPLGVQVGLLGDLPLRDVRDEAPGRWSESARIEGEKSDDGGTLSSSFRTWNESVL